VRCIFYFSILAGKNTKIFLTAGERGNCQGNKKPQPDVARAAVVFKLNFQGLIAAVESNQQAQNEDEQVDVSQVHRQCGG
jgi:hypothetical protein